MRALDGTSVDDAKIVGRVVPNVFFKAIDVVRAAINEVHPDVVVMMGESRTPCDISDTPRTFCCNHLMYGVLHYIATTGLQIRAGWIHLPYLPSTAAMEENMFGVA